MRPGQRGEIGIVGTCLCMHIILPYYRPDIMIDILLFAVLVCIVAATPSVDAFQSNQFVSKMFVPHGRNTNVYRSVALECHHHNMNEENNRRDFLNSLTTTIAGTSVLIPQVAKADEEESIEEEATIYKQADTITDSSIIDDEINKIDREENDTTMDKQGDTITDSSLIDDEIDKQVDSIIKDEIELDAEVIKEEADEKKVEDDEVKLLNGIEKEIAIEESDTSTEQDIEKEEQIVKDDTETLIKEEEQLLNEAKDIIEKIESIENEVNSLAKESSNSNTETTSEAFVDKLKQQVEQKEDLITRLKRASENDIDPRTGKFKKMTPEEYKKRAKSTDTDFMQFLKDTVLNEKEYEQDLNAFEGFLDREVGPLMKELKKDLAPLAEEAKKDLSPIATEIEDEFQKDVLPAIRKGKDKAGKAAGDEIEELKEQASGLIGKLRSIF